MGGVKGLMAHGFHFHLHCLDWKDGGGVGWVDGIQSPLNYMVFH